MSFMMTYAYAGTAAPASPAGGSAAPPMMNLFPILGMLVLFYFFLLRPQQKRAGEHKKMLAALQKGDVVVTNGGIYGTVLAVGDSTLEIKIADNVKVKVLKSAVSEKIHAQDSANGKTSALETPAK